MAVLTLATQFHIALLCEFHGIVDQMFQGVLQTVGIGEDLEIVCQFRFETQFRIRILPALNLFDNRPANDVDPHISLITFLNEILTLCLRQFQQVVDDVGNLVHIVRDTRLHVTFL